MTTLSTPSLLFAAAESAAAPTPTGSARGDELDEERDARIFYSALGANVLLSIKASIAHDAADR